MILEDLHVHTTYCDGKNSPEEIVRAALELNMKKLGFSCHSYTDFDESYCIKKERVSDYIAEIRGLGKKYKDKIEILCGVEQDYYSNMPTDGFDYVIGSVHYVKKDNNYFDVDNTEALLKSVVTEHFDGDFMSFCEAYFKNVADIVKKTNCDIIGHFDLVTKFNENGNLFDTGNSRYEAAAFQAIDEILKANIPFEINTGAISRGYKKDAYPEMKLLEYICKNGGRVILSSDSHSVDGLCNQFDRYEELARDMGFAI